MLKIGATSILFLQAVSLWCMSFMMPGMVQAAPCHQAMEAQEPCEACLISADNLAQELVFDGGIPLVIPTFKSLVVTLYGENLFFKNLVSQALPARAPPDIPSLAFQRATTLQLRV